MAIDSALGRLGIKQGVCTSSTRPTNPFEGQVIYESDTNRTLVYDNAAWVVVADNQVLSIDTANSRVGIGTTTPTVALQVDSGSTDQFAAPQIYVAPSGHASSDRAAIQLDDIQLLTDIAGDGTEDFSIYSNTAASHRLSIDGSGNVGINTFTPTGRIHLYSNTAGNGQDANYLKIDRANTSTESAVNWATAGTNKWFLGTDNTGSDDILLYDWVSGNASMYGDSGTGILTFPEQPAFTARITTTGTLYNSQVLPFSSASLNLGNHYNTSTYLFTAPISGHYFFSYSVLIRNNSGTARTETGFWKNGGWLMNRGNSYVNSTGSSSDHNQASSSVITYMSANDTMGIYQLQTSPSDTYGGTSLSIFTGRLVS